jgi:hypothetical protein
MSNIKNGLLLLVTALVVISCGKKDSPSSITEKFLAALSKQEFENAKIYGTDDTDRLLDMMIGYKKMGASPFMQDAVFDVLDEKISGDAATVRVKVEGRPKEMTFNLEKEEGKWKVAMNKETINESDANIFDLGATNTDTTSSK